MLDTVPEMAATQPEQVLSVVSWRRLQCTHNQSTDTIIPLSEQNTTLKEGSGKGINLQPPQSLGEGQESAWTGRQSVAGHSRHSVTPCEQAFFGRWEETGVPRENSHGHVENMQTLQRKKLNRDLLAVTAPLCTIHFLFYIY